jgi:hypothetical protein
MTYKHSTLPFGASSLVPSALFDSAQAEQVKEKLSPVEYNQLVADISNIRGWALSITLALADAVNNNELGDDTPSDYLDDLMLDAVGIDADDEMDTTLENILAANIADALSTLGVDSTMIEDMFSDDVEVADAAIEAACEVVLGNLPDAGEPLDKLYNDFVFSFNEADLLGEEAGFDGLRFDGQKTTRKVNGKKVQYQVHRSIRNGQVAFVAKRLKGQKVRLSAAQKQGLKKANAKSQTANAIRKRLKSRKKGQSMGLYK